MPPQLGLQQATLGTKPALEREPRLQRKCSRRRGESARNRFQGSTIVILWPQEPREPPGIPGRPPRPRGAPRAGPPPAGGPRGRPPEEQRQQGYIRRPSGATAATHRYAGLEKSGAPLRPVCLARAAAAATTETATTTMTTTTLDDDRFESVRSLSARASFRLHTPTASPSIAPRLVGVSSLSATD